MKILFAINSFDNGGAENFMLRLARTFCDRGHQIALFSLNPIEVKHTKRLSQVFEKQLESLNLIEPYKPSPTRDWFLWKINRIFKSFGRLGFRDTYIEKKTLDAISYFQPDIINSHLFETDFFMANQTKTPLVVSMHGPYEYYLHKLRNDDGEINETEFNVLNQGFIEEAKQVFSRSHAVIYCADKNLEIFDHVVFKGIKEKIYYGFPIINADSSPRFPITKIGMFSRGVKSKGWEEAIDGFLMAFPEDGSVSLHLAFTSSPYMSELKTKYKKFYHILFLGEIDPIDAFLEEMDLILFPTYYKGESLPNCVIESLAKGKPVVGSNQGEIPLMLKSDGEMAGDLVNINDSSAQKTADIAKFIAAYTSDQDFYNKRSALALDAVKKFSMETCYLSYLKVFEQSLKQKHA